MPNAKQTCLDTLKSRILTLGLPPGAAVDEASTAAEFGISRTPFREVLQRLSGEGYIDIEDNRGATVASMDLPRMRTFFQTAPLIYAATARQAAENANGPGLTRLRTIQDRFRAAINTPAKAALENHRFHHAIGDMAANPYLMASLSRMLIDHTRLSQTFYRPETSDDATRINTAVAQHDAMIDAFAARDADAAAAITIAHWDLSRDRMERFVRPDPIPFEFGTAHAV
ncbi:MAG: GntR family transcriptional regulator [Pseudomonadota bacterium]